MVQKKADSIHQLDGWNLEFRKKYREGAAAFPELHQAKRAAAFVASSTASKQAQIAYGADEKKCFLSYLTVDIQKYLREKEDYSGRELLYVGSLIQRKGLDLLLPALAETSEDIHLTIVGEGQERELLTEQAGKLGITDRIRFLGYVEGEPLRELYHNADVFILPTREDCFGLVILEAMCASLPVISQSTPTVRLTWWRRGERLHRRPGGYACVCREDRSDFADENRLSGDGNAQL